MASNQMGLWLISCCPTTLCIYLVSFLLVGFTLSSRFRYYIRFSCLILYYFLMSFVIILMTMFTPGSRNNIYKISKVVRWTDIIWGIKYNINGIENFKEGQNYVIVSNHQSMFDMNIVLNLAPKRTACVAKRDILYIPVVGFMFWLMGMFLINRKNHDKAVDMLNAAAEAMKREKFNVLIFPEGTRHQGKHLLPFKKGAFHLAQQTQFSILPIVISNYEDIIHFGKCRFSAGTINITILPEVTTVGLKPDDVPNLTQRVHSIMENEYEK
ncbi:1-acyl-sn-glycerol-3-phosphate acyltransferase alpha-like [Xenia sp. Carnegie-2017]|uniref:1-acyl-sn-glycerol-3-phosphate acyltransferase alpha-like n=1 Tax=Xenia sp. Carnegie-2017 TaxID=2897299 RepID=UPI001F040772|nr:1-acyl-sn-glycerol-3-phosphate acyltransferase alpha-like [Xenia sp. Carnegie-2017]